MKLRLKDETLDLIMLDQPETLFSSFMLLEVRGGSARIHGP